MTNWISVDDELPKIEDRTQAKEVWISDGDGVTFAHAVAEIKYNADDSVSIVGAYFINNGEGMMIEGVKYWMYANKPLPPNREMEDMSNNQNFFEDCKLDNSTLLQQEIYNDAGISTFDQIFNNGLSYQQIEHSAFIDSAIYLVSYIEGIAEQTNTCPICGVEQISNKKFSHERTCPVFKMISCLIMVNYHKGMERHDEK